MLIFLQSQWMDFQNLKGFWKLKKICTISIELLLIFFIEFHFQFEFSYYFDFQEHKRHLENFVFETLFTVNHRVYLIGTNSVFGRLGIHICFSWNFENGRLGRFGRPSEPATFLSRRFRRLVEILPLVIKNRNRGHF